MCTAITLHTHESYFGRNLDLEYSYNETVTVTPRNFPLVFRKLPTLEHHYAMIGMAYVCGGYPLYYDAVNEHGLAIAGLNFPGNAVYYPESAGKDNVTPFELIPWLLGKASNVAEVRALLAKMNLYGEQFSPELPLSPLHWIIADRSESITLEAVADGMHVYDNPVGVLTNNPPFDFMLQNLASYRDLSPYESQNRFAPGLSLPCYCRGIAAIGLPGDWSSASRFVRAAFCKLNSDCEPTEQGSVGQFFHLLSAVEMPRGCVRVDEKTSDITVYTSCMNQDRGIYYYTTYSNRRISAVDMHRADLDSLELTSYPLMHEQDFLIQN